MSLKELRLDDRIFINGGVRLVNEYWECNIRRRTRREVKENLVVAEFWMPPENGVVKNNYGTLCGEGKEEGIVGN